VVRVANTLANLLNGQERHSGLAGAPYLEILAPINRSQTDPNASAVTTP
jgi:hypothetical protein